MLRLIIMMIIILGVLNPILSQTDDAIITPQNAHDMIQLNRLGNGRANITILSPDGHYRAIAGSLGIWIYPIMDDSTAPRLLSGHEGSVSDIVYHPNGTQLASASWDMTVRLWDVETGDQLRVFEGHTYIVDAVVFHPNGQQLASAGATNFDKTVRIWDIQTGEQLHVLTHEKSLTALAYHPNGLHLLTTDFYGYTTIWDIQTGLPIHQIDTREQVIESIVFSPDAQIMALASVDNAIQLLDANTFEPIRQLIGHEKFVFSVSFSPDGRWLVSGSEDNTLRIWDLSTGETVRIVDVGVWVWRVHYSPDGRYLLVNGRIWDAQTGVQLQSHPPDFMSLIREFAYSPSTNVLAVSHQGSDYEAGWVRVWDIASGELISAFQPDLMGVGTMAFSPNGDELALLSIGIGEVRDARNGYDTYRRIGLDFAFASHATYSPDGQFILASSYGYMREWDAQSLTVIRDFGLGDDGVMDAIYNRDATHFLCITWDGGVQIYERETGELLQIFRHDADIYDVAYSPDEQVIATATKDGYVRIWDVQTGMIIHTLVGHQAVVNGVAFSPDGLLLASASDDKTIRVWDVVTGAELVILSGHTGNVSDVSFTGDGINIVSASQDATVRIWGIPQD